MPSLFDPTQRAGARVLLARIGVVDTILVGSAVARAEMRGEPFDTLPAPEHEREAMSRAQIGPAILLYRELMKRRSPRESLAIVEEVVTEAAVIFLGRCVGSLARSELDRLDDSEREAFVKARGEKFFNATLRWDEISADRVRFTVTHCRFPGLCTQAGHPELAPVFCKGDAKFFGEIEPDVELIRPQMIATGGENCPFTIQYAAR